MLTSVTLKMQLSTKQTMKQQKNRDNKQMQTGSKHRWVKQKLACEEVEYHQKVLITFKLSHIFF